MLALILFWLSVFIIFYTYIGFILVLIIRAKLFPNPFKADDITPSVSVIIAAYNEIQHIENRIRNIWDSDYPADRIQIIVASDGSDDGTNEVVKRYENEQLKLLALPRGGKAAALNSAIQHATGDILIFTDANTQFAKDAIRQIVRPFADETVGGVAGDQRYLKPGQSQDDNYGERVYWNFDRYLKETQTQGGHVTSATGAIYAIRRQLYRNIQPGIAVDDFFISTSVIGAGYRLVFSGDALAYEYTTKSQQAEFGRKVRIISGGLAAVMAKRHLLNPFKFGFYAHQLFVHKVLRRLLYIPLIIIFFSNILLVDRHILYLLFMVGQILFYGMALIGWLSEKRNIRLPKVFALPYFLCMVYWAAIVASWSVLKRENSGIWSTQRE